MSLVESTVNAKFDASELWNDLSSDARRCRWFSLCERRRRAGGDKAVSTRMLRGAACNWPAQGPIRGVPGTGAGARIGMHHTESRERKCGNFWCARAFVIAQY